jgi:hypothetical protein
LIITKLIIFKNNLNTMTWYFIRRKVKIKKRKRKRKRERNRKAPWKRLPRMKKKESKAKRLLNPIKDHLTAPKTKTTNTRSRRSKRNKPDKKTIHNDDIFLVSELRRLGHGKDFKSNATIADIKKQFNWTRTHWFH